MNGKKTYQVVRAGIARTFQNIRLFDQMTVEENVLVAFNESFTYRLGGAIFRTPTFWKQERDMHAKAIDLLRIFGLEGLAETEAANLPYGAQRKLEIARALATGMKLLLLDEPAAGMNPTETEDLLNCINTIRDRFGIAILLIEHDMSLVMNVCQRIQVLDYGRTIASGTPEEIANNPQVISAYLGADDAENNAVETSERPKGRTPDAADQESFRLLRCHRSGQKHQSDGERRRDRVADRCERCWQNHDIAYHHRSYSGGFRRGAVQRRGPC